MLMPDYPAAKGRAGYAVGLDVPASVIAALGDLAAAGYAVNGAPQTPRDLLDALSRCSEDTTLRSTTMRPCCRDYPGAAVLRLREAWGEPSDDPDVRDGAFHFRARKFGNIVVALPPDRGRAAERRADYHDAVLPPRHALVAFGLWLRHVAKCDALVHMGAHGTLEWLPGKAVALTADCFPEIVTGALPVIYPFIVSNPGEAAQAKRRIAGLTISHLPPPLVAGGPSGEAHELERCSTNMPRPTASIAAAASSSPRSSSTPRSAPAWRSKPELLQTAALSLLTKRCAASTPGYAI